MNRITTFEPTFASSLPATFDLLMSSNLMIHPSVPRITLHGSRGLAGGCHPISDIDLSLIVHNLPTLTLTGLQSLMKNVLETTRGQWRSTIELDLAIAFETRHCALKCFDQTAWNDQLCTIGGMDCFGLYKVGKGFDGFVSNTAVKVEQMYPCLKIWERT